jgi:murein L,D-transpeptidase YafK
MAARTAAFLLLVTLLSSPRAVAATDDVNLGTLGELSKQPVVVVVFKRPRTLAVYKWGKLASTFPIVLGSNPDGAKKFEGDMRTPEGLYTVTAKKPHPRWRYFIAIDYPNDSDLENYHAELQKGLIPKLDGRPFAIGSGLGIHGNNNARDQSAGRDWTRGCIAMRNVDVTRLYRIVAPGTPVWILRGDASIADDITAVIDSRRAHSSTDSQ